MALTTCARLSVLTRPLRSTKTGANAMKQLRIGDITIDAVIEREGPLRLPQDFFPASTRPSSNITSPGWSTRCSTGPGAMVSLPVLCRPHAALHHPGRYLHRQTRPSAAVRFSRQERWRNELSARHPFEQVDYVFCTHLHIDHTGWNTTLRDGRWVPTFPNAKYIFHKREYAAWEADNAKGAIPPGTVFRDNCLPIVEAGQAVLVDDDLRSTYRYADADAGAFALSLLRQHLLKGQARGGGRRPHASRHPVPRAGMVGEARLGSEAVGDIARKFFASVAGTDTLILPVHFPTPTAGLITADGDRFDYRFNRGYDHGNATDRRNATDGFRDAGSDPQERARVHQGAGCPHGHRGIIEVAKRAPSSMNTQPWHIHVLTGEPLENCAAATWRR